MLRPFLLLIVLSILALGFACSSSQPAAGGDSPAEAYKLLYAAVKSKDIEAIKRHLSKKSIEFGAMAAAKNETPVEKMYENGFTATTFSETLPNMRDERIKDSMGAIEVWNSKEKLWEDVPFIMEDGVWKIAFGDLFAGSFVSPGYGRDRREREAANAVSNAASAPTSRSNANTNLPKMVEVPQLPDSNKKTK